MTEGETSVTMARMSGETETYRSLAQSTVGQRITWLMLDRRVSVGGLAEKIGVTPQGLLLWRKGQRKIPGWAVAAMAIALDTSADFILGLIDDSTPSRMNSNGQGSPSLVGTLSPV